MMKWLTYILSIYIIVLAATPCVDGQLQHLTQSEVNHSSSHHSDESDHCSPLCTCQCCASPVVFTEKFIQTEPLHEFQELHFVYVSHYQSSDCKSIWQPPQLG